MSEIRTADLDKNIQNIFLQMLSLQVNIWRNWRLCQTKCDKNIINMFRL
jgi:hypothetical protein